MVNRITITKIPVHVCAHTDTGTGTGTGILLFYILLFHEDYYF